MDMAAKMAAMDMAAILDFEKPTRVASGSCLWTISSLPIFALTIVTPSVFYSRLKTHLFHKSFPPQSIWCHLDCLQSSQILDLERA